MLAGHEPPDPTVAGREIMKIATHSPARPRAPARTTASPGHAGLTGHLATVPLERRRITMPGGHTPRRVRSTGLTFHVKRGQKTRVCEGRFPGGCEAERAEGRHLH
ncbi:hypothetical protein GCM10009543_21160 [Leifsonia naganoensis]